MEHSKIPKDQVFPKLRDFRVKHLGEVKRLYLEADGSFSLMRRQEVVAGLCILPEWDKAFIGRLKIQQDEKVCDNCGWRREGADGHCRHCNASHWSSCVV